MTGRTLTIDVSQPTVVDRIQRLQRLETVVYTMDKIVSGAKRMPFFPDFLAGDRLLMLVHGEVVAGIDFSNLKPGDVKVDGKEIHLHLPPPQVFSTRIDSTKTRVYSRQTGSAGADRSESGNASAPGGGTPAASRRHGRWHSANSRSRTRLRRSPACCRAWDSKRLSSSDGKFTSRRIPA